MRLNEYVKEKLGQAVELEIITHETWLKLKEHFGECEGNYVLDWNKLENMMEDERKKRCEKIDARIVEKHEEKNYDTSFESGSRYGYTSATDTMKLLTRATIGE